MVGLDELYVLESGLDDKFAVFNEDILVIKGGLLELSIAMGF